MAIILDHFPALGTAWWVEVFSPLSSTTQDTLTTEVRSLITIFEARYSRFRPDSLVSTLNAKGSIHEPDDALREILLYGQALFVRSAGAFNMLVGETLEARGYDAHYRFTPKPTPTSSPNPTDALIITPEVITLQAGHLDFGGFGKGYLIDLIAAALRAHGIGSFLINGGGDLFASEDNGNPLTIYLEHPTVPGTYLGTTTLHHQGFAASSPFKRRWVHNGTEYNHIVGTENQTQYATFVKADSARDADAFATASLLWNDAQLASTAEKESIGIARYNPATSELTRTNFAFSPL